VFVERRFSLLTLAPFPLASPIATLAKEKTVSSKVNFILSIVEKGLKSDAKSDLCDNKKAGDEKVLFLQDFLDSASTF
jgi:hypothetical protein